ncbi:MAG TPA: ATP-binding cassette domain-containing protein [Burkholderiaceae bacterium]|nr:ATP-binding cassette domain-containing protein [Burkholderiaceae bacterium]
MGGAALVDEVVARVMDLRKRYRARMAVDGIDLEVRRGELFGVIGPDGAGKSSLMKSIAGVLAHDAGTVEVFGVTIDSERAAERIKGRIGFMPQGLGLNLYPELSVEENIDYFARLRLVAEGDLAARKEELLAMARLARFRDRPMKNLSGGMKQKLALVCTLIHEPELVILDEPTTGVDPVSRRDFWTILGTLRRERAMTALVSTAYMDEAMQFDRLALVHSGRVLAQGRPAEIQARNRRATGEARETELEDVFIALIERAGLDETGASSETAPIDATAGTAPAGRRPDRSSDGGGNAIEAHGLTRDFGAFRAVDGVSFSVRHGEIFGLLGSNGAGKTTAIKMLTGILPPTTGSGRIAGVDMRRAGRDIRRRIGYVSQAFSLYTDLTAAENLTLYAGIYGLSARAAQERIAWTLAMNRLTAHANELAGDLPVGLRQRLALGCALLHRPQVLFLDEPTSGVDPLGRRRFWDILFALARDDGVAILVTTHYMGEAEQCDRVALMHAGRVVDAASPAAMKRAVEAEAGQLLAVDTDRPAEAAAQLRAGGFADAQLHGGRVHTFARDPARDATLVARVLADAGLRTERIAAQPLSLEDVFVYRIAALERGEHERQEVPA